MSCSWEGLAERHGDVMALLDPHHSPATKLNYRELNAQIQQFAAGLAELGLQKGDKVFSLADPTLCPVELLFKITVKATLASLLAGISSPLCITLKILLACEERANKRGICSLNMTEIMPNIRS